MARMLTFQFTFLNQIPQNLTAFIYS